MTEIYRVGIQFTEPLLASAPANRDVYTKFIESRRPQPPETSADSETTSLPIRDEESGWSVFHIDPTTEHIFLYDYHILGFLKEAASAMTGKALTAFRSKIARFVFVFPRRLYLMRDGQPLSAPEGALERAVQGMTAQGPRISLKRSDMVREGVELNCEVRVLPIGAREITEDMLKLWFSYGEYKGLGEWRNASYGRFGFTLEKCDGP